MWFHSVMTGMHHSPLLLRDLLAVAPIVLLDGAWGTLLAERNGRFTEYPARAVIDAPELVLSLAKEYVTAGAMTITTDTFRASPYMLKRHLPEIACAEFQTRAMSIAREAGAACVLGSISPLRVESAIDDEHWLHDQFLQQADALYGAGCITAYLETFASVEEASIAVAACREAGFDEVVCSIYPSWNIAGVGEMLMSLQERADIVGVNCIHGVDWMVALGTLEIEVPLLVRPNAGTPGAYLTPGEYAELLSPLFESSIRLIGGCCGTTPAHVEALSDLMPPAAPLW